MFPRLAFSSFSDPMGECCVLLRSYELGLMLVWSFVCSAGKSTTMSIVGGLDGRTDGQVVLEGGHLKPPRGTIGIVPQKNVLFPELTCLQTLRVWRAVKWSPASDEKEDLEQLLRDCDLGKKINFNANALSGGQKRKLQLAIGLLGGSKSM